MSSLGEFHHAEEETPRSMRIVAWVVIALIVGGIGVYVVESGMLSSSPAAATHFPRGL